MPSVILNRELARRFTAGETRIDLDGDVQNVRGVIQRLDERFPGLGGALRGQMSVAIDGVLFQDCLLETVGTNSEVCFMPAIDGG